MLNKAEDMQTFLRLVEANAPVKRYQNELGFSGGDVRVHIKFLEYYRTYIRMSEEIKDLVRQKAGASTLEKAKIGIEIRKVRTRYRDLLIKSKAGSNEV